MFLRILKTDDLAMKIRRRQLCICFTNFLSLILVLGIVWLLLSKNSERNQKENVYVLIQMNSTLYPDRMELGIVSEDFAAHFDRKQFTRNFCWSYLASDPRHGQKSTINKEQLLKQVQLFYSNYNHKSKQTIYKIAALISTILFLAQTIRILHKQPLLITNNRQIFHLVKHFTEVIIDCILFGDLAHYAIFQDICISWVPSQFADKFLPILLRMLLPISFILLQKQLCCIEGIYVIMVMNTAYLVYYYTYLTAIVLIFIKSQLTFVNISFVVFLIKQQEKYLKKQIVRNKYLSTFFLSQLEPALDEDLLNQVAQLLNSLADDNSDDLMADSLANFY